MANVQHLINTSTNRLLVSYWPWTIKWTSKILRRMMQLFPKNSQSSLNICLRTQFCPTKRLNPMERVVKPCFCHVKQLFYGLHDTICLTNLKLLNKFDVKFVHVDIVHEVLQDGRNLVLFSLIAGMVLSQSSEMIANWPRGLCTLAQSATQLWSCAVVSRFCRPHAVQVSHIGAVIYVF